MKGLFIELFGALMSKGKKEVHHFFLKVANDFRMFSLSHHQKKEYLKKSLNSGSIQ